MIVNSTSVPRIMMTIKFHKSKNHFNIKARKRNLEIFFKASPFIHSFDIRIRIRSKCFHIAYFHFEEATLNKSFYLEIVGQITLASPSLLPLFHLSLKNLFFFFIRPSKTAWLLKRAIPNRIFIVECFVGYTRTSFPFHIIIIHSPFEAIRNRNPESNPVRKFGQR